MKLSRRKIDMQLARKQMTVSSLAEVYGVSRPRMTIILGNKNITPICAGRLAEALGVDIADILED